MTRPPFLANYALATLALTVAWLVGQQSPVAAGLRAPEQGTIHPLSLALSDAWTPSRSQPAPVPAAPSLPPTSAAEVPAVVRGESTTPTRRGVASTVGPRFPSWYLALPAGPGHRVRICGRAACVVRVSTDKGPDQRVHPERIADLSVRDFERVCGCQWRRGLQFVTVERLP